MSELSMIYTIGNTAVYSCLFEKYGEPMKKGRTEDYPGGSVWRTYDEAKKHCPPGYSVYGVSADFDEHTTPSNDGDWNDLLIDAPLTKIYL